MIEKFNELEAERSALARKINEIIDKINREETSTNLSDLKGETLSTLGSCPHLTVNPKTKICLQCGADLSGVLPK